jgi:hypothetical protein
LKRWLKMAAAFAVAGPVGLIGLQAYRAWAKTHRDFENAPERGTGRSPSARAVA